MEVMVNEIKSWIYDAGEVIKKSFQTDDLVIDTKSGRTDLVTNLDKATQKFLTQRIMAFDPDAKILGEEDGKDRLEAFSGRVFIIDPIDGTMNFVLEQENFCIMVAVYEDGIGKLGFVYNVMKNEFLWGGRGIGVYCNDEKIEPPKDISLSEGLIGLNHVMYQKDSWHVQKMGEMALGVRMTGCAGYELIGLLMGRRAAYVSRLAPWDYAPGGVLIEELGLRMSNIEGHKLNLVDRELFVAATPKAYENIMEIKG
ncbi:inositol monophosphatase [Enterococcus saigonensis]|uniref:Inositol monophosphatase n=1 Tax=Enterococcus saigonensis TaxID=1805431 RepID=A0A679IRL1_9ENTE|nr:inositol monophosphatase family protein [Enterococcus saigonensis]BCA85977.1 inositol monophosphatase [Enterococcus saigonensis]